MELETKVTAAGRFAALLAADAHLNAPHDRPLLQGSDWVVAPTLGSIVPNWTILIPKMAALSFRDWARTTHNNPADVVDEVTHALGLARNRMIWFEHGPRKLKSSVGCGVDYAHLHLLIDAPFSVAEVVAQAQSMVPLAWRDGERNTAYASLGEATSYLAIGSTDDVKVAENVDHIGSQFLRRAIASVAGRPARWNYRDCPEHDNIEGTIKFYRALHDAAHRDQ